MRKSKALFRVLDEDTYLYSFPFPSPENGGGFLIKKVRTNVLNILDIRTNVLYNITMIVQQESKMQGDYKEKLSLSVLLAVKGLQPLEMNCIDHVFKVDKRHLHIRRWYNGDFACYRDFTIPKGSISQYEYYEETPPKKIFSRCGKIVH